MTKEELIAKIKKIWTIIKKVLSVFGVIFTTIFTVININDKQKEKKNEEVTKDEIEKKDAADIIAESNNQNTIQQSITDEQNDFRKRVRDRLNKNL